MFFGFYDRLVRNGKNGCIVIIHIGLSEITVYIGAKSIERLSFNGTKDLKSIELIITPCLSYSSSKDPRFSANSDMFNQPHFLVDLESGDSGFSISHTSPLYASVLFNTLTAPG